MSVDKTDCETSFSNITYLIMIIFFLFGYIIFSHLKIRSCNLTMKQYDFEISRKDNKISTFFGNFDEFNRISQNK